jgi:hypothetical protein
VKPKGDTREEMQFTVADVRHPLTAGATPGIRHLASGFAGAQERQMHPASFGPVTATAKLARSG